MFLTGNNGAMVKSNNRGYLWNHRILIESGLCQEILITCKTICRDLKGELDLNDCFKYESKYDRLTVHCKRLVVLAVAIGVACILGCQPVEQAPPDAEVLTRANIIIETTIEEASICDEETVFNMTALVENGRVTLTGETTEFEIKQNIVSEISEIPGVKVIDEVTMLPATELGDETWAVVKEPVINLGAAPGQSEDKNTVTQARMGDIVRVLIKKDDWYLVQMEDKYLGWVDPTHVSLHDSTSLDEFWSGQVALIQAKMTEALDEPEGQSLFSRWLVQGTVLPLVSVDREWSKLRLPEGDNCFVKTSNIKIFSEISSVFTTKKSAKDVIVTAKQYLGLPYLWGGCTSYGFDCSGFTQFCMKMNGYQIRRDADMQYEQGEPVNAIEDLKPGDLVFFETYKSGPSHVGIYIGDYRYIHAGSSAGVAINSFYSSHPEYAASLASKFLGGRRIIK